MRYNEWKLLTESIGSGIPLGLSRPNTIGGIMGTRISENEFGEDDEEENEDEEGEEEEVDDEEGEGEEDLLGVPEEGPEKSFPPDSSEKLDGLPTPDEEMIAGDELGGEEEMDPTLAGIDPDLAGLGDDDAPVDDVPPELGAEVAPDVAPEDEIGEPCPDCNMDGTMAPGEGDPDCPTCSGDGFVGGETEAPVATVGGIDAEIEGEEEGEGDKEAEMLDLMSRMQSYCRKYAPAMMQKENKIHEVAPAVAALGRAALSQAATSAASAVANKAVNRMSRPSQPQDQRQFMDACPKCKKSKCHCEHAGEDFLGRLRKQATGDVGKKFSRGISEDMLVQVQGTESEPGPGDVGFSPQGRVGGIGGGYTKDDFSEIPVLGEATKWPTLTEYAAWKARYR